MRSTLLVAPLTLVVLQLGCTRSAGPSTTTSPSSTAAPTSTSTSAAASTSTTNLPPRPVSTPYTLRYDQLGYLTHGARWAVLLSPGAPAPTYQIYDLGTQAFVGPPATAGPRVLSVTSRAGTPLVGDQVDLSAIPRPGSYLVVLQDGSQHGPIVVGDTVYANVLATLCQFYEEQRCGNTNATASLHGPCHLFASIGGGAHSGDGIAVDDNFAASVSATTGPAVDVEGGWHDAGDYLKFVGTTSYTLSVTLLAVRDHPSALAAAPAGAAKDTLRAELRWGLDWLVAMVGGTELYHQVSGQPDHDVGFRAPESDTHTPVASNGVTYDQRPVFRFAPGQGANLLGRSAAAFALGSQVYADDPPYAANLLALARSVYAQGKARPAIQNPDPANFYQEDDWHDDMAYGAAILAQVTGDATYAADALGFARQLAAAPGTPVGWDSLDALAYLETGLAFPAGSPERQEMANDLVALAGPIVASNANPTGPGAAFRYALPTFGNGTLAESLGAAIAALAHAKLVGDPTGLEVARSQLHWLFGQNPFGLSFMIGVGSSFPGNPHNSLFSATGARITGAIMGGPTGVATIQADGLPAPPTTDAYAAWSTDDLVYEDSHDDYTVNEPAIDYTAGLVFALAELLERP